MKRRLLNFLTALSLLLCVTVLVPCVLSYTLRPEVSRVGFDRRAVAFHSGSTQFYRLRRHDLVSVPIPSGGTAAAPGKPLPYLAEPPGWHYAAPGKLLLPPASRTVAVRPLAHLSGGALPHPGMVEGGGFEVSLWPMAVLTGVLPALWILRGRHTAVAARRAARGLCPACGYDVRATPGRCPECGHVTAGTRA